MGMENKDRLLKNLAALRARLKPLLLDAEGLTTHVGSSLSGVSILNALNLIKMVQTPPVKEPPPQTKLPDNHQPGIPLKEMFALIQDGYKGKFNNYLQEALSNAEVEVAIKPQNSLDENSRQMLEIKIQVAATMIDNYSGLLEMAIGHKGLSKEKTDIINKAHKSINNAANRLRRIELRRDILRLNDFCEAYLEDHKSSSCWPFFSNSSKPSKQYQCIVSWFAEITMQPLSEDELIGALYSIRSQIQLINNKHEMAALRDGLDYILKKNGYPEHTSDHTYDYLRPFIARARVLDIDWPKPFQPLAPGQEIIMELTM